MHLGSEYQVRVAAWLAVEMLAGRHGEPLGAGGTIELLRGETQESVDDLLVGTVETKYGFIQAKRALDFSDKLNSDLASVIDQMVRQVVVTPEQGSRRPWSRELSPATDRLLLVTGPRSSEKVRVVLRDVLKRARSLAPGQPLSDAAVTEAERAVLQTTVTVVRHFWKAAGGEEATDAQVHSLLSLMSIEVLDVEEGQLAEREAKRTLGTMIIADVEQEGAAWSSVLKACRRMVTERSGLNLDSVRQHLQSDGIALKTAGLSSKEAERAQAQSNQIDKLIDEARDAIRQFDHPRARLLLERIERDHSSQLNNAQRFRVISNHGFAALGLGRPGEAAKRFLEAHAIQPQDEKARINEVLAYYVVGDAPTAFAKAEAIRPLYPASAELACYWVSASPAEKTVKDVESELSSILLEDHKVRLALAQKALLQRDLDTAERHAEKAFALDSTQGQPKLLSAQICMARIVELEAGRGAQPRPRKAIVEQAERGAREAARLAEIQKDKQTQGEAVALLADILLYLGRKEDALDEADRAFAVSPNDLLVLLSRSQAQFANRLLGEGIVSLRRAFSIEPRADIAFHYGKALFERSKENDLQMSVQVLAAIDLSSLWSDIRSRC